MAIPRKLGWIVILCVFAGCAGPDTNSGEKYTQGFSFSNSREDRDTNFQTHSADDPDFPVR